MRPVARGVPSGREHRCSKRQSPRRAADFGPNPTAPPSVKRTMHRTFLIAVSVLSAAVLVAPAGVSPSAAAVSAVNSCEGRTATLVGTAGPDVLIGTSGPDVIAALEGDDQISGREGDDVVCGGGGSDFITGGSGDDRLFAGLDGLETWSSPGGAEYPVIFGDLVDGGPGDDWLDLGYDDRERSLQGEEPDELLLNGLRHGPAPGGGGRGRRRVRIWPRPRRRSADPPGAGLCGAGSHLGDAVRRPDRRPGRR